MQLHGGGIDFHLLSVNAGNAKVFTLSGLGLAYTGFVGGKVGIFAHVSSWRPFWARQDGSAFGLRDAYTSRFAGDALLGMALHRDTGKVRFEYGVGLHTNYVVMNGERLQPWTHSALGIGFMGQAGYALAPRLQLGVFAAGTFDFVDLAHGGDLDFAASGTVGLVLSARPGRKDAP